MPIFINFCFLNFFLTNNASPQLWWLQLTKHLKGQNLMAVKMNLTPNEEKYFQTSEVTAILIISETEIDNQKRIGRDLTNDMRWVTTGNKLVVDIVDDVSGKTKMNSDNPQIVMKFGFHSLWQYKRCKNCESSPHKCSGKSSLNVNHAFPVCPVFFCLSCLSYSPQIVAKCLHNRPTKFAV